MDRISNADAEIVFGNNELRWRPSFGVEPRDAEEASLFRRSLDGLCEALPPLYQDAARSIIDLPAGDEGWRQVLIVPPTKAKVKAEPAPL